VNLQLNQDSFEVLTGQLCPSCETEILKGEIDYATAAKEGTVEPLPENEATCTILNN
jgi:hypothetical protein